VEMARRLAVLPGRVVESTPVYVAMSIGVWVIN